MIAQNTNQTAAADSTLTDTTYIERNINIEKEYIPEITKATRSTIEYTVQEHTTKKADIIYSGYASDVRPNPQFYPINPLEQRVLKRKTPSKGYAAVGLGYPINWLGQLYYPIMSTNTTLLEIFADHDGYLHHEKRYIDTDFSLDLKHAVTKNDMLYASIGYANRYYTYYGTHTLDSTYSYDNNSEIMNHTIFKNITKPQSIHNVNAMIGASSINGHDGWTYNATLKYDALILQNNLTNQHSITLDGVINKQIANNNLAIGLLFDSYFYGLPKQESYFIDGTRYDLPVNLKNNAILGIKPAYQMQWNSLNMHLGAKIFLSFNKGMVFNITPDIHVDYNIGHLMNVYATIGGDYKTVSLADMLSECRYWYPMSDGEKNLYTPIDAKIGFNIKPIKGMLISFNAGYRYNLNDHIFVNKHYENHFVGAAPIAISNQFTALYTNTQDLSLNARLSYNFKELYTAYTTATYHFWYYDNAWQTPWHRPSLQWEIGTEMRPVKNLVVNASFYLATGYKAGIGIMNNATTPSTIEYTSISMPNHYDLNLGASYRFDKTFTLFARLNNLLGIAPSLRYQDWYGYENIGFNCLIGLKFNF